MRKNSVPLNKWQEGVLSSLKDIWCSIHECKKVSADFVFRKNLNSKKKSDGEWQLKVSPVYQEVLGGIEDGAKKVSCFTMDLTKLILAPHWEILQICTGTYCSFCQNHDGIPSVRVSAKFKNKPVEITIYLQPVHDRIEEVIMMNKKNRK